MVFLLGATQTCTGRRRRRSLTSSFEKKTKKTSLSCSCLSHICTWSNFNIFRMWKTLPHIKRRKKAPAERGHSGWRITSLPLVICEFGKISQLFSAALFLLDVTFCPRWSARIKQLFTHLLFHFSALTLKREHSYIRMSAFDAYLWGPLFKAFGTF